MANDATELADLFDEWHMKNWTPLDARSQEGDDDRTFWARQTRAVGLLESSINAMEELQAAGEDVRGIAPYVNEWYKALFSVDVPWTQVAHTAVLRSEAIGALRNLGLVFDLQSRLTVPSRAKTDDLRGLVRDAEKLLEENRDNLDAAELEYVFRLLRAVDGALAEKATLGTVNLREHIDRLNGALVSVASQLTADGQDAAGAKVWKLALGIVATYRGLVADVAAYAAITGVSLQQLT